MMEKSKHYDLKKKYYELLAYDPDYPAWNDFEFLCEYFKHKENKWVKEWRRIDHLMERWCDSIEYRYNPLPKKWEPENGGTDRKVLCSYSLTKQDAEKLQAYATKLSWLRENGGYDFKAEGDNYLHYFESDNNFVHMIDENQPFQDAIYMNKEQASEWVKMLQHNQV